MSRQITWPKRLDYTKKIGFVNSNLLQDKELTPGNFYICVFQNFSKREWYGQVCRCVSFHSIKGDHSKRFYRNGIFHEYNMQLHTGARARCFWAGFFIPLNREERRLIRLVQQL